MTTGPSPKKKLSIRKPVPAGSFMMRRVFRQGEQYYCGICRAHHSSVEDANHCLELCWKTVLHRAPWTTVKRIGKLEFACIYCQRGYASAEQATKCAEECASRMSITGLDGRDHSLHRTKHTFAKPNVKIAVNFPFKIGGQNSYGDQHGNSGHGSNHAGVAETNAVVTDAPPSPQAAPAPAATEPAKDTAAKEKVIRDRSKKFERHGSKYVCVVCQKKYFEKIEVEKCFDSHSGGTMDAHQNSGV